MKKSVIFLFLAVVGHLIISFVRNPRMVLPYIFSWNLFYMFSATSILLLILWELAWFFERSIRNTFNLSFLQFLRILFVISLFLVLALFVIFHPYTLTRPVRFPIPLEIYSILEAAILDIGSLGMIPWLAFALSGGLVASFLNLPNDKDEKKTKNAIFIIAVGSLFFLGGLIFLTSERFVSPALAEPSSLPHIFLSIGFLLVVTTLLILLLDKNPATSLQHNTLLSKIFTPLTLLSKITLTIFLVHYIVFILDPSIIPSETIFLMLALSYVFLFVLLAHFWQKWEFKYSVEWMIRKYTRRTKELILPN